MDEIWLELSIKVQYKADPKDYSSFDPEYMASIDQDNFLENHSIMMEVIAGAQGTEDFFVKPCEKPEWAD
jgi:hypothetical protein